VGIRKRKIVMDIQNQIKEFNSAMQTMLDARRKFCELIENLPANPNTYKTGSNSFTMNISEVFKSKKMSLSPLYYDFTYQYRQISIYLMYIQPEYLIEKLQEAVTNKYVTISGSKVQLHDNVIANLKSLL
jgi:hypothetical protein